MYVDRLLTKYVLKASRTFPAVLITGPHQSGKTTLLTRISEKKRTFVSLDDLMIRNLALTDPELFFQRFKPPVFIDEIQYAPNLLPYIKLIIDEKATRLKSANGLFWLSGSQNFALMDNVSESLAGRVAIMNLLGFSLYEFSADTLRDAHRPFFLNKKKDIFKSRDINMLFRHIVRGSMPRVLVDRRIDVEQYYSSYIQTYIERDIRGEIGAKSLRGFEAFIKLLAARSGQLLNMASLSQELGISLNTVKSWISLLEKTFQIYVLKPYHTNLNKREVKTPKVYFIDSGLLCYLTRWNEPSKVVAGPLAGVIFENWVIAELLKSYWHRAQEAPLYFYRTRDGSEVDIFCLSASNIIAAEIKLSATFYKHIFPSLENTVGGKLNIKERWIFSPSKKVLPLDRQTTIFPASSIF